MNVTPLQQVLGNVCVAAAALLFLLPLQKRVRTYARKHLSSDEWVVPVLVVLVPVWLLLVGGLLCVTASGGFDWLGPGRTTLHVLTVAATFALGAASFVFIGLYIRPGFTPRILYVPGINLVPFATMLMVVLSLNAAPGQGGPPQWLRLPWVVFAGFCMVVCGLFVGKRFGRVVEGVLGLVARVLSARDRSRDHLARIAALDPQTEAGFHELLDVADVHHHRTVREAATERLRAMPEFTARLLAELGRSEDPTALEFLEAAVLSVDEQAKLARPTRAALERFIEGIPAPNYLPPERRKQWSKWGRRAIPVIIDKFSGTDVDFSRVMPDFEHAMRPDDSHR